MPNYDLFNSPIMAATWKEPVNAEFLRGVANAGGAPQLQEAVADEQAQANFNRDMANNALMAEMANRGAYGSNPQSPALVKGFMPGFGESEPPAQQEQAQPQTLTQMARQKALDIINAKNLYAQGEAIGGEQGAKAMELAHAGAERARADLQQLGFDPAQYGLNGTYEEAAQGLANNDMRTLQNVLDGDMGKTSIAHYDDMYNYLIEQGASREIAAEVAGQRARTYAIQRIKTLKDAFNMYGHDGKVINPMGVQLLQKLGEEEPDMANYYTQRYAGPLQEYADAKQQRNMATQQANKERTMEIGHKYEMENKAVDQKNRLQLAAFNNAMADARAEKNQAKEFEIWKAKKAWEAYIENKSGKSKGKNADAGLKTSEAVSIVKLYQDWNEKNPDNEAANPFKDAYDEATAVLNNQQSAPSDVNDSNSVYSWATSILEENYRRGYPATPEALYQAIASVGGYGKAVADDLKKDGLLEKFGRTN